MKQELGQTKVGIFNSVLARKEKGRSPRRNAGKEYQE